MQGLKIRYRAQEVTLKGETGRFVLPPEIRKQVRLSSGDQRIVCLYPHATLPCIAGYGLSRGDEFEAELNERRKEGEFPTREAYDQALSNFYGAPTYVFDDSGRFAMPESLQRHARISNLLYFHSYGPEFWIFSKEGVESLGPGWDHIRMGFENAMALVKPGKSGK